MLCPQCAASYEAGTFCPRDGTALLERGDDPLIGHEVDRYRIVSRLGSGGMGVVYRAVQTQIHSQVAIKVLTAEAARERETVDRFFAEARAVNLIRNEHIVNVLDLSTLPDGRPYLVMELLDGQPLSHIIAAGGLSVAARIQVVVDVLSALAAAHAKGIVHRDVKPDNVFVSPTGRSKLLDFGIAKVHRMISLMVFTEPGILLGTPHYMSPEQARGQPLDARADVYAVGIMLYELMAGVRPFQHAAPFEVLRQQTEDPPVPPRVHRSELSPMLEQVILGALAKDRALRFSDALTMRTALLATPEARTLAPRDVPTADIADASESAAVTLAAEQPPRDERPPPTVDARPVPTLDVRPAPTVDAPAPTLDVRPAPTVAARPPSRRRWLWIAVGVVTCAAIAIAARSADRPQPRAATDDTIAPAGWRAPRSRGEQAALLASRDPAIQRWAASHDPERGGIDPSLAATTIAEVYAVALARMQTLSTDVQLRRLNASNVSATGALGPSSSVHVELVATMPRPAELAPTATWEPYCVLQVSWTPQGAHVTQSTTCDGERSPLPACSLTEIMAHADTASANLVYVAYDASWSLTTGPRVQRIAEPCRALDPTWVPAGLAEPRSAEEWRVAMDRYAAADTLTKRWLEAHDPTADVREFSAPALIDGQQRLISNAPLLAYATTRARQWAADARLVAFDVSGIAGDGSLSTSGKLRLQFMSATLRERPADITGAWTPYCTLEFELDQRGVRTRRSTSCSTRAAITPRCELAEVLRRSVRPQDLTTLHTVSYASSSAEWAVRPQDGSLEFVRDRCP